jgi:hypothetical protein
VSQTILNAIRGCGPRVALHGKKEDMAEEDQIPDPNPGVEYAGALAKAVAGGLGRRRRLEFVGRMRDALADRSGLDAATATARSAAERWFRRHLAALLGE